MEEQNMRLKLMIPGPIELEDEVLDWMGAPVQVHYGDEWVAVHNETIDLLQQVFATVGKVFMMPGSGSLALDTAIQSTFAPGERVAVGVNGHFGNRLTEILTANGVIAVPVSAEPNQPLSPDSFARVLDTDSSIVGVAIVHLETSTAILNPVCEIAQATHERNRLCLVDAVSSLGCVEFQMDAWNIDLCLSASQKGLGGAPGIAIVAVGSRAWERINSQPERPRSWYLDLRRWQWYVENWGDWHPFPVTMPTSVVLGLRAGLQSLLSKGLEARLEHYEHLAKQLRNGLRDMGMPPSVPDSLMSPVLTAAYCPPGITSSQLMKYLADEHHIKITTGFGELRDTVIRIGHMGGALTETDIETLLSAIRQYLAEKQVAS
jgi:alanine-glyoxylate transaminase / serine-glyoxylate transaminase / serine-pyruvate transaminase